MKDPHRANLVSLIPSKDRPGTLHIIGIFILIIGIVIASHFTLLLLDFQEIPVGKTSSLDDRRMECRSEDVLFYSRGGSYGTSKLRSIFVLSLKQEGQYTFLLDPHRILRALIRIIIQFRAGLKLDQLHPERLFENILCTGVHFREGA